MKTSRLLLLFLTCAMMLIASGCATNPVTGKSELTLVGEATEISIGREQYLPAQQSQGGQYLVDPQLTQYVNEVGMRLAAVSDRKLPYEFVVINDSTPNAWALPGGKIALNRGLLVSLESEAELAAVLGHEIVHAAARHGAKSMERSMLLQGALVLTAIGAGDSEYSNHILGGAQLGAQLLSQRYGRQAELDADYYGMAYMARAGYDPAAAISLQEKFVALKEGRSTSWLEGLFASHPPSEDRVARNRETSEALKAGSSRDWDSGTNRFRQHLAYLSSKQPAYQAFDQARALIAKKETDVALSRVNRAISIEPKEPRFLGLKADIHLRSKKYDWAINNYSRALDLDDDYFEYYLGRGLANARLGNRVNAREDLERSNQLLPTALATNELGNLSLQAGDRATAKDYYLQVAQSSGPLARSARSSFIRLDLKDNPAEYFAVRLINQEGHLYVAVQNQSSIPVRSMTVAVAATINGETRQTRVKSGPLEQDAQTGLSTGWRISATDQVTASRAVVVSVSP